jgi:hypothetical protein
MFTMNQLFDLIRGWATDRNIIAQSDFEGQFLKAQSEAGELCSHAAGDRFAKLKDDVGDVIVCLTNAYACHGINIEDVVELRLLNTGGITYNEREAIHLRLRARELKTELTLLDHSVFAGNSLPCDKEALMEKKEELHSIFKTLTRIANGQGWTLNECVTASWHDIKDRRGLMVGTAFVKEQDFTKEDVLNWLETLTSMNDATRAYLNGWLKENA